MGRRQHPAACKFLGPRHITGGDQGLASSHCGSRGSWILERVDQDADASLRSRTCLKMVSPCRCRGVTTVFQERPNRSSRDYAVLFHAPALAWPKLLAPAWDLVWWQTFQARAECNIRWNKAYINRIRVAQP